MSQPLDLQRSALADISRHCAQQTEHFFQGQACDPRYCFELFRRAIVDRNDQAWKAIYDQYSPLVVGWVGRHAAFAVCGEEAEYLVNGAFEKMWAALTPDKFDGFVDLRSLLRYLQMCVHSVILDQARGAELSFAAAEVEMPATQSQPGGQIAEDRILDQVQRREFWQAISARLQNEKERCVVYGSFVLGLKPRELCTHFRGLFSAVDEVYRVKENVLARLSRDAALKEIVGA